MTMSFDLCSGKERFRGICEMRYFTLCEDGSHQEYQGISMLRRSRTLISQMPGFSQSHSGMRTFYGE